MVIDWLYSVVNSEFDEAGNLVKYYQGGDGLIHSKIVWKAPELTHDSIRRSRMRKHRNEQQVVKIPKTPKHRSLYMLR